jgi:hypothetical protein
LQSLSKPPMGAARMGLMGLIGNIRLTSPIGPISPISPIHDPSPGIFAYERYPP